MGFSSSTPAASTNCFICQWVAVLLNNDMRRDGALKLGEAACAAFKAPSVILAAD
jgi:hypothetical protein